MNVVRWGILGTGLVAKAFTLRLRALPDASLVAVGSRRQETAESFADALDVPNRYGSYEALANTPEVDVVYTPHTFHDDSPSVRKIARTPRVPL